MKTKIYILLIYITVFTCLFCGFTKTSYGRSVYAITKHPGSQLSAYNIQGDQISHQIDIQIDSAAIGIALDPDSYTLFFTYDNLHKIVLVNAKTMTQIKSISTTDELAGIGYDQARQKVYAVRRQRDKLYIYLWDPIAQTLTLENGNPQELENLDDGGAYGLAFDEEEDVLYVTDATNEVKYYDASDQSFDYLGNVPITIGSNGREAVGIDCYNDGQGAKYLYTGAWMHSTQHEYLVRTDITYPNNPLSNEWYLGSGVGAIGIAVDQATGYVYITTSNDHIEVYNNSTFPTDPCDTDSNDIIDGPADIIVRGDVSYKPPIFDIEKVDVNEPNAVVPEDYITYEITYGPNGFDHNYVVITDYLPYEVNYISSPPDGNYNEVLHTVTWEFESLDANDSNDIRTITVQVNHGADPNGIITNYCEIECDKYFSFTTADTNVGPWEPNSEIIYVDCLSPCDPGTGMSWKFAYRDLQDALERAEAGCGSQIWVAEGTYSPSKMTSSEPESATFQLVSGVSVYGGFPTGGGQRKWLENETILDGDLDEYKVDYVVLAENVNEATILDGFTIKNGYYANIEIIDGSPTIIRNIIKQSEYNAGIHCKNDSNPNAKPNIINCKFEYNKYSGIYCKSASPTISNCVFVNNGIESNTRGGGGICCHDASPTITSCTFHNNKAYGGGAMINDYSSSPHITNCTFTYNNSYYGGGILNYDESSPELTNCIFWYNYAEISGHQIQNHDDSSYPNFSYCDIKGGLNNPPGCGGDDSEGHDNIDTDPCFYEPDDPNSYHLTAYSLCIDKGVNEPPGITMPDIDIDGEDRIIDGNDDGTPTVDMGADEYYWSPADFNRDEIVNFLDYAMFALAWDTNSSDTMDYNDIYDIVDNDSIDYNDLRLFCNDWLWMAAWGQWFESMSMGMGMGEGMGKSLGLEEFSYLSITDEKQQPEQLTKPTLKEILKWLEELWLDPEVQEAIDEDTWLKFIESLKQELQK